MRNREIVKGSLSLLERLTPSEATRLSMKQAALVGVGALIGSGMVVIVTRVISK